MSATPHKILHLIDTAGPGGAETIFLELVCRVGAPAWSSAALVPKEDWLAASLRARGCDPVILCSGGSFDFRYLARLRTLVAEERIGLVQTHLLSSSVYGTLAVWGRGIPLVATFHGLPDIPAEESLVGLKRRILGRRRNRVVFVSESLKHGLGWGDESVGSRSEVIPNGIDCDLFRFRRSQALRRELGLEAGTLLIGALGNVRPSKRYGVLLEAFAKVKARIPLAHLAVAGQAGGPLFEDLLKLQSALGLEDSVHFLGFREDVPEVLQSLDLFVLSSSDEGFSLATVQAMATGLPIVATRCGGPEEILEDGVHGRLTEANDPEGLARGILEVAFLPDRGERYAAAARARAVSHFSMEAMVRRYEALYRECLGYTGAKGGE